MSNKRLILIHGFLFCLAALLPAYTTYVFVIIICINAFVASTTNSNNDTVLISTTLIGSEMLCLISIVLLFAIYSIRGKINNKKIGHIKKATYAIMLVILINSLLSSIMAGTVWNVIFYIVYLVILSIAYKTYCIKINTFGLINTIRSYIQIEFLVSAIICIRSGNISPGDIHGGSLINAHFFANWLMLSFFSYFYLYSNEKKGNKGDRYIFLADSAMIIIMVYLASANAVLIGVIGAIVLRIIFNPIIRYGKNELLWIILGVYIGFYIIIGLLYFEPIKTLITTRFKYLGLYLYNPGWNYKMEYFKGTLYESLKGIRAIFGYGIGQYGSRVANAFAYDYMWRGDNGINNLIASIFPSNCIPEYARFITFYTTSFVEGIRWRSSILSYPFSSFISILAETGIIGVGLISYWINRTFKRFNAKILIYYFLIVCIFDIFFDDLQCVLPLIMYICFLSDKSNKKSVAHSKVTVK